MPKDRRDISTKLLLLLVNVLVGLSLWMGYKFADHTETMLTAHESRLDSIDRELVALRH